MMPNRENLPVLGVGQWIALIVVSGVALYLAFRWILSQVDIFSLAVVGALVVVFGSWVYGISRDARKTKSKRASPKRDKKY